MVKDNNVCGVGVAYGSKVAGKVMHTQLGTFWLGEGVCHCREGVQRDGRVCHGREGVCQGMCHGEGDATGGRGVCHRSFLHTTQVCSSWPIGNHYMQLFLSCI